MSKGASFKKDLYMIREIEKPKIDFKFLIYKDEKFYYDEEHREYFIETEGGSKFYFNLEGKFHRIGRPAINYCDGEKKWKENGKNHRLDGPAHIYNSNKYYWINSKHYSEKEFAEETKHLICKSCGDFCRQKCFF